MTTENLKGRLTVHPEGLHHDAEEQPGLACEAAELAAEAKAESRRKKLELEELKAVTQGRVRSHPESFGIDKVTEKAVESAVTGDAAVALAERAAIDADLVAGKAEALANAFEHRRAMLKLEAELWLANYFGDITVKERQNRPVAAAAGSVSEARVEGTARRRRIED